MRPKVAAAIFVSAISVACAANGISAAVDAPTGGFASDASVESADGALSLEGGSSSFGTDASDAQTRMLLWSDEFNGANGSAPDSAKWTPETGGNGWGNEELETYTSSAKNAYQEGGRLVIKVIKETVMGTDGISRNYTSSRLITKSKFSQKFGRFEARIKIPFGQGLWPAFWLLGDNISSAPWPACGEIDVMENIGKEPATVHGTIHGTGYSGASGIGSYYSLSSGRFADDFHVFAVEWEPSQIRFYVDANLYASRTPSDLPLGATWAFDHGFYILLNVAVGGTWPGNPDSTTTFPQAMMVDYVRAYQ